MILFEDRAATVLYNVLISIKQKKFLLPLNVCPIVPDTFLKAKKEFEFVDISLDTLCMDYDKAISKIKNDKSIDGVLFVKTFGIDIDSEPFYKEIKGCRDGIFVIDDMCPSVERFDIDIENSYADMTLFSSGYSKYIDIGYGGYGFVKEGSFGSIFEDKQNMQSFLDYKKEIEAKIPLMDKHKATLNRLYKEGIDERYHLGERWNRWRFSLLVDNKDEILDEIFKLDGLFASSHYPQVDFEYVKKPQKNTNTSAIHSKILNLFNDFRYDEQKALKTIEVLKRVIR